jgi:hypothetical protein
MYQPIAASKSERGFTLVIPSVKRGNILPIGLQISLKAQSKRYNKSKSRAKGKRQWKQEV